MWWTTLLIFATPFQTAFSQKKAIDTAVSYWPTVRNGQLTADGKFGSYAIRDDFDESRAPVYVIKSISGKIIYQGRSDSPVQFTSDSKSAFFKKGTQLMQIVLGTEDTICIQEVSTFKVVGDKLLYQLYDRKGLYVRKETSLWKLFPEISSYSNITDQWMLCESKSDHEHLTKLLIVDLHNGKVYSLGDFPDPSEFRYNEVNHQFALSSSVNGEKTIYTGQLFKNGSVRNVQQIKPAMDGLKLKSFQGFTDDGKGLLLDYEDTEYAGQPKETNLKADLNIYSYLNSWLPGTDLYSGPEKGSYTVMYLPANKRTFRVEYPGESKRYVCSTYALLVSQGNPEEKHWNRLVTETYSYLSFSDGKRDTICTNKTPWVSPGGRFFIYLSASGSQIVMNDTHTGKKSTLSAADTKKFLSFNTRTNSYRIKGFYWLSSDSFLLSDGFDLWQIDAVGVNSPINITGGYGKRAGIVFIPEQMGIKTQSELTASNDINREILLNAFGIFSKKNGFFKIRTGIRQAPEKLFYSDHIYHMENYGVLRDPGEPPLKARHANIWLVRRMSTEQSPNYFLTSDFKSFRPFSENYPEKAYKGMRSELMDFNGKDGQKLQGVLYKPEDFDPAKRYPVIFYCYEELSQALHYFWRPEISDGMLNIPWYVSRDYLVFTPDINYNIGHPMRSALSAVEGAAEMVAKLPYVDSTRMGLQGHSYGAVETNFIVTHSKRFAAACSASGFADWVSAYGAIAFDKKSFNQSWFEVSQNRIGASLWERPDLYLDNSTIFDLPKITTPILLMGTTDDNRPTDFQQAMELISGLRRLGKKAWLLMYSKESHTVDRPSNKLDFTIRMQQFFDHYLKGFTPPLWMTRDRTQSLNYDTKNKTPGDGLLNKIEQIKVDSIKQSKIVIK